MTRLRLRLKSHSWPLPFSGPAPCAPFLVSQGGTSLISHLFPKAHLWFSFWGTPPENSQTLLWVLVLTLGGGQALHIHRLCGIPSPRDTLSESPGCACRRAATTGPGEGPCVACLTPGHGHEATMNITPAATGLPSDHLFCCCLIRLFPNTSPSPASPLVQKVETMPRLSSSSQYPLLSYLKYIKAKIETGSWLSFATRKYILGLCL